MFSIIYMIRLRCFRPGELIQNEFRAEQYLVLLFPILRQVSQWQLTGVLSGIATGIGISNFLRAFLMMCLNSSSFGSMKNIFLNCLALSSFGVSIAHLCFCFALRCVRHKLPHIWPYIVGPGGRLFPRQSSPRTTHIFQVAFRSTE